MPLRRPSYHSVPRLAAYAAETARHRQQVPITALLTPMPGYPPADYRSVYPFNNWRGNYHDSTAKIHAADFDRRVSNGIMPPDNTGR